VSHAAVMPSADLSLDQLQSWGEQFGQQLEPPAVVLLSGDLGAGKTTLVQAICRGYGVDESVTSPTFSLLHQYAAPKSTVNHFDLYRIESPADLTQLGWQDEVWGNAVTLVEWPERAGAELPAHAVHLQLRHLEHAAALRRLTW